MRQVPVGVVEAGGLAEECMAKGLTGGALSEAWCGRPAWLSAERAAFSELLRAGPRSGDTRQVRRARPPDS